MWSCLQGPKPSFWKRYTPAKIYIFLSVNICSFNEKSKPACGIACESWMFWGADCGCLNTANWKNPFHYKFYILSWLLKNLHNKKKIMRSLTPKCRGLQHTRFSLSEKMKQHKHQIFLPYSILLGILVAGYLPPATFTSFIYMPCKQKRAYTWREAGDEEKNECK